MLQHSLNEEYIPNQPIESQYFLPDLNAHSGHEFLFPPNLLTNHSTLLDTHQSQWGQLTNHTEYEAAILDNMKTYPSNNDQIDSSIIPHVSVRHQPDYKTDFVSFGLSGESIPNLSGGEPAASKIKSAPANRKDCRLTRDTAKSLRESTSTWRMQCTECSRKFNSIVNLQNHIASVHHGVRPHRCEVCDKTFGQKATLRTHKRVHTGEKPYKCNVCTRYFADLSTCKKHQRVHDGQKPYECEVCKKRFSQSGNMIRHREGHDRRESRINITTYTTLSLRHLE